MVEQDMSDNPYTETSPYAADRGFSIGKDPRKISQADLAALDAPKSPVKAIRAHCVLCSGGSEAEARKCTATDCSLWPYRMGKNVFHTRYRSPRKAADMASEAQE